MGEFRTFKASVSCGAAVVALAVAWSAPASAQLTGGAVVAGKATISQPSATSTLITQTSSSAILTWTGFSIPHGSSVTFVQPSSSAIALNRVLGGSPSFLFGTLSANGQVWLINPAGIVVGRGGSISAAGVLLSTADIHNADFLAGNYSFDIPGKPKAGILNRGTITAGKGGSVVLAGAHVTNEGLIAAALGSVVVAGASTYAVDFAGDGLLSFAITSGSGAEGTLVDNKGTISAQGGLVLLTAQAATSVLDNVINTSGIIEATSAANIDGKIVLSASGGGTNVSGLVDASGKGSGQTGGTVEVLGDSVTLASGAKIDVSGDAGGGTALIGGNFHGAGPLPNAGTTTVSAGSIIDADAITSGDGGRVAVWSDDNTTVAGSITARGGAQGGNGGYLETSGGMLDYAGITVDLSSAHGQAGTWLLDPDDLVVTGAAAVTLAAALGSNDIIVETGQFSASSAYGTVNTAGNGDITIGAAINWSSGNSLTLSAYRNIAIDASITNTSGGAVTLQADNTGTGTGTVTFGGGAKINTTGAVTIFYNPASYASPTNYTGDVSTPASLTAYMLVNNFNDLQNISTNLSGTYALGTSIFINTDVDSNFTPVGNVATPFTGTFDGRGMIVDSLTIVSSLNGTNGDIGLFGDTSGATIRNIGLTNVSVTSTDVTGGVSVGSLIGSATNTTITNAYSTGSIAADAPQAVGGLIGALDTLSSISNSNSSTAINTGSGYAGGLVGSNDGLVTNSYAMGFIGVGAGDDGAGGLVGDNDGQVQLSFATGSVSGPYAGGLVGVNFSGGTINQSYATGIVSPNLTGGGLVGYNDGTIRESYATGNVSATEACSGACTTGGLVGENDTVGSVVDSYALGAVSVGGTGGGLVGQNNGAITQSYEVGSVTGSGILGALIGDNAGTADALTFWDTTNNSSPSPLAGVGTGVTPLASGMTTTQLSAGVPSGYDTSVWAQNSDSPSGSINGDGNLGIGFPYLQWSLQTVTGTAFSDRGVTPLSFPVLNFYVDGVLVGRNGSTVSGTYTAEFAGSGPEFIVVIPGSTHANTFYDGLVGTAVSGVDLYGGYVRLISSAGSFSTIVDNLSVAQGSNFSNFYFTTDGSLLTLSSGISLEVDSFGTSLVLDESINTGTGNLALGSFGSANPLFTQIGPITATDLLLNGPIGAPPSPGYGNIGNYVLTNPGNNFAAIGAATQSLDVVDSVSFAVISSADDAPSFVSATGAIVLATAGSLTLPPGDVTANTDTITLQAAGNVTATNMTSDGGAFIITANSSALGSPLNGSIITGGINTASTAFGTIPAGSSGGFVTLGLVGGGTGNISLTGNITTANSAITFTGPTVLNASSGPVVIDTTNATPTAAGASVAFSNSIDNVATPADGLTITAGTTGAVVFGGTIGATTAIGALTVTAAGVSFDGNITTSGAVTFNAPVTLPGFTATIDTTDNDTIAGANVVFGSSIDGTTAGGQSLSINAGTAGTVTFTGGVGAAFPLGMIVLNDAELDIGAGIGIRTSNGEFLQAGATVLEGGAVILTDTVSTAGSGAIIFSGPINGTGSGNQALTLNAGAVPVELDGALGGSTPLGAVTLDGGVIDLGANITTNGGPITFNGPVRLLTSVVLNANATGSLTGGAAVTFNSTLDGSTNFADNLTITAGSVAADANVNFAGRVGADQNSIGTSLGAVTITSADAVNMTVPFGANGDGFSAGSLVISPGAGAPGAASLTTSSYIDTNTGGTGGVVNIVTTGNVAVGLDIFTAAGFGGPSGASGGTVTINAGGSVSVGAGISLTSTGSGTSLSITSPKSIETSGETPQSLGQNAGNGGAVTITGTNIALPQGVQTKGGDALVAGSINNGGNGGLINLTATAGNVTIGSAATGPQIGLKTRGGDSLGGSGGNGGNVTVSGPTLAIAGIDTEGGDSGAASAVTGGNAGAITLVATGASGPVVTLFGTSTSTSPLPISPNEATLDAQGGVIGDTLVASGNGTDGTFSGDGGNITIGSSASPTALNGTGFIALTDSTAPALNGGPTVVVFAAGGVGHGGQISIDGPVQATTSNVESLLADASNGSVTIFGAVGSTVALNTVGLGFVANANFNVALPGGSNGGTITFMQPVTAASQFVDQRLTGTLTLDANLTSDGGLVTFDAPVTLGGNVVINTTSGSAAGAMVKFANTVDGATAYADGLTITAGTAGNVVFTSSVGGNVPLGPVSITGNNVQLTTAGGGLTAASFTLNATSLSVPSGFLDTAGSQTGGSQSNGGAINITTTGAVTIGGSIFSDGGVTVGGTGGNGGAVTINAGGAVAIGTNLSLTTSGSGATLLQTDSSVFAAGFDASTASQTPGNGGAVSITGSSINLPLGVFSRGGEEEFAGSTNAGGNAATLALTATAGAVTIGIPNVTGNAVFASAAGGDSPDGPGGAGAAATITGTTISLSNLHTSGGASAAASGPAAAGGNITLYATAASGAAITFYGETDSPTSSSTSFITLSSRGGLYGATQVGPTSFSGGTITGSTGSISIGSGPAGAAIPVAPLNGTSFIQLDTGAPGSLNGGSTVEINGSAPAGGGDLIINGPIEGASANVQSLHLRGNITVLGPIGNLVALNTLATGTNSAAAVANATFDSSVTATTEIDILPASGNVTFEGKVTTADFLMSAGTTTLGLLGGTDFTGTETFSGGAIEIEGPIDSSGVPVIFSSPIVLEGATTIDTTNGGGSPGGAAVTFGSTLDGATAYADNLTITAGGGTITFAGRVGEDFASIGVALGAVNITTTGAVNLTAVAGSNNDGFTAASITMNAGSLTTASYLDTQGADSATLPTNGGAIDIVTTGSVNTGGDINTGGGVNSSTGVGGNGGTLTIHAGGSVAIGTALTQTTVGSGVTLDSNDNSIFTAGSDVRSPGQTAGNAGAVLITGSSINIPIGLYARGGVVEVAGSTASGGSGASVTLTATGGGVTVGIPTGANATGIIAELDTSGGDTPSGSGGNAGNVAITGQTITLAQVAAHGGDTGATSGFTASGGNITLIATASSGAAVTLYGDADVPGVATNFETLSSRGGEFGATEETPFIYSLTSLTGAGLGGNVTIEGSAGGAQLNGSSFVQLATSTATGLNGGSLVDIHAAGGPGEGGTINIRGPIEATTANVENLDLRAGNGNIIVTGAIGNLVALNTLTIGDGTTSTATFDSSVTTGTAITDTRTAGSLVIDGAVTTGSFDMVTGATTLTLLGGGQFTAASTLSGGPMAAAGTFVISGTDPGFALTGPLTLAGTTTFNTGSVNGSITLSTVGGTFPLNLIAGTGTVTLNGAVGGGSVTLTSLNAVGGTIAIDASVTTFGSQTYIGALRIGPTAASTVTLTAGSIDVTGTIDGPGALKLIDGPPSPDILVTGPIGSTVPLASLTINGSVIELGSVTTEGPQTYTDSTLVLTGSNYQTDGAAFTETGATIIDPASGGTITIDTTGNGSTPVGGDITFTSPGTIDAASAVTLNVDPGSAGTVNTGTVGSAVGLATIEPASSLPSSVTNPPPIANSSLSTTPPPPPTAPPPPPTSNNPPPPPPPPGTAGGGPESAPGEPGDNGTPVINQVTDLDSGSTDFTTITGSNGGNGSPPEPFTIIAPITQPTQPVPTPVTADTVLGGPGSHLFVHSNVYAFPPGVPGIANSWPTFGNRGLWFTGQIL